MRPDEYLTELKLALSEYRFRDVRPLTDQADLASFELPQIKRALGLMRRKRLFPELEHAASLFVMVGNTAPVVRRLWCQSLLDQNRIPQALAILQPMSGEFASEPAEGPEIRGLIGRAYKQHYINEGGSENLRSAINAYLPDWQRRQGDYRWQGINLVALLSRANHDGVDPGCTLDPVQIARNILDDIEEHGAAGAWDYATAMEASVALGDTEAALAWARQYVQHPGTDAFELGSTLRQFKEVWSLKGSALGDTLLPALEYALLQREGESVQPLPFGVCLDPHGFEAVYGPEGYVYLQWIDTLYGCCNAIGRVGDAATGKPCGTGFLVSGSRLNPAWGAAPVFLTNAHVISCTAEDEAPLRPAEATVEFTRLSARPKFPLGEFLFSSPRVQLDVSILRIDVPPALHTLEPCAYEPKVSTDPAEPQRIYVIGHPSGSELAVSLYDNNLVEYEKQYVRYRSPTEGGHSGSPVLTRQLKTFAVHHRALYDRQLNEGISLNALKSALESPAP